MSELNPSANLNKIYLAIGGVLAVSGGGAYVWKNYYQEVPVIAQKEQVNPDGISNMFYRRPTYNQGDTYLLPTGSKRNEEQESDFADLQNNSPSTQSQRYQLGNGNGNDLDDNQQGSTKARGNGSQTYNQTYSADELLTTRPRFKTAEELMNERRQALIAARRAGSNSSWTRTVNIDAIEAKERKNAPPTAKDYSEHEIGKDVSTYPVDLTRTITADRYIDCAVKEQINSQLEGRVTCQIINDVYGVHGRKVLIPAGSTAIGKHTTLKKVGDERFNIIWERIIRAGDGVHISLTEAYSSDRIGSTGIGGIVNNRNFEKYGGAVLTSTISAAAQIAVPVRSGSITNSVIQSYGTDLGQVTAAMINEGLNIKPYSIVTAGTIIKITPTTDIWLKHFNEKGAYFAPVEEK